MKHTLKTLFSLMLAVCLLSGLAVTASASQVTYEGNSKEFIFTPGSEYSPTDLFENFKNVMPGDKISQKITVVNHGPGNAITKIYMKALGPTPVADDTPLGNGNDADDYTNKPVYQALLNQLKMTVKVVAGDIKLFDAPANETDGLTDWVLLGTLHYGGEVELEVTLEVPITMGNEFQDVAAELDWVFKVEEEIPSDKPVDTGDTTQTALYATIFGASAAVIVLLIIYKKKSEEKAAE